MWLIASIVWRGAFVSAQTEPKALYPPSIDSPVAITVVGGPADLQLVRSLIDPRLFGGSAPRWTRVPRFDPRQILQADGGSDTTLVRCWVDLSDPLRGRLYFAARSGQRFLVRDLRLSGAFDELDRESLSHVVELSIAALLDNEEAGLTRAQAQAVIAARDQTPRPVAEVSPSRPDEMVAPPISRNAQQQSPSPQPSPWLSPRITAAAFYGAIVPGKALRVAHGPGVSFGWEPHRDHPVLGAWISGQYQWPEEYGGPSVGVAFQTFTVRGGLKFRMPIGSYQMNARAGMGADIVRISPRPGTPDSGAELTPRRWSQMLVFTAMLGMEKAVGSRVVLGGAVLADILPTAVHYDVVVEGNRSEFVSPWRVRPGVMLEIGLR